MLPYEYDLFFSIYSNHICSPIGFFLRYFKFCRYSCSFIYCNGEFYKTPNNSWKALGECTPQPTLSINKNWMEIIKLNRGREKTQFLGYVWIQNYFPWKLELWFSFTRAAATGLAVAPPVFLGVKNSLLENRHTYDVLP